MPLVWAHSEYVKLSCSLRKGHVFDMPPQTVQRYLMKKIRSPYVTWSFGFKCRSIPPQKILRLELRASARVRWSTDRWHTVHDNRTRDTGLGIHVFDVPADGLLTGTMILFTFYWPETGQWEGADFVVAVE
jgi:glucoamylase